MIKKYSVSLLLLNCAILPQLRASSEPDLRRDCDVKLQVARRGSAEEINQFSALLAQALDLQLKIQPAERFPFPDDDIVLQVCLESDHELTSLKKIGITGLIAHKFCGKNLKIDELTDSVNNILKSAIDRGTCNKFAAPYLWFLGVKKLVNYSRYYREELGDTQQYDHDPKRAPTREEAARRKLLTISIEPVEDDQGSIKLLEQS